VERNLAERRPTGKKAIDMEETNISNIIEIDREEIEQDKTNRKDTDKEGSDR